MREDGADLERAHDAAAGDVRRPLGGDVLTAEIDRSRGRLQEFGEHVEDGGLADQCVDLPAPHAQVDAVDRDEPLELLHQVLSLEDRVHASSGGYGGQSLFEGSVARR